MRADVMKLTGLFLLILACFAPFASSAHAESVRSSAVAKDARVGGDLNRTRFVADLSETVEFRAFLLSNPYRVIVDLPEVQFQMPSGVGGQGRGLVSAFRYGLFATGKSRIVIDVVEPVAIDKAFVRAAENGQPARLVIDLVKTTADQFQKQSERQSAVRSVAPNNFQTSTEPAAGDAAKPGPAVKKGGKPIIVLDPGHGGVDPGTISVGGIYEKHVVFDFCVVLRKKLEDTGRFRVLLTRDTDVYIPLDERVTFASKQQASLLISIHADAIDPKNPLVNAKMIETTRGASIYTLSEDASDELAQIVAAKENRSDVLAGVELPGDGGDELASILIDLMHRETKTLSIGIAKNLLGGLHGKAQLTASPHRFANFKVLKAQDVPSVLVELGYLSNSEDERALTSDEWRSKVGDAIVESISAFFAKRIVSVPG